MRLFRSSLLFPLALLASLTGSAAGTANQHAKVIISPAGSNDHQGRALAFEGDTLVVGAPDRIPYGFAYVFMHTGSSWEQLDGYLSFKKPRANIGASVAISGDTIIAGAPHTDFLGSQPGQAYIYVWNGVQWIYEAMVMASDSTGGDGFGSAVGLSGDTAIVGAPGSDQAYAFLRFEDLFGVSWAQAAKLSASADSFGASVALAGDRAVIGAPEAGAAFVFERNGDAWDLKATLVASGGATDNRFGRAVALLGDTVLVGAPDASHSGIASGAAYVFVHASGVWTEQAMLVASDAAAPQAFGASVALVGNRALVGAPGDAPSGQADAGAAYAFLRAGTVWTEQGKFTAPDAAAGDRLGATVCIADHSLLAGADRDTYGGVVEGGSVREFVLSPCAGSITDYGAACSGSGGYAPQFSLSGCPAAGATLDLDITGGLVHSQPFLLVGLSQAQVGMGASCILRVNPALEAIPLPNLAGGWSETGGTGLLSFPLTIPIGGVTADLQVALIDAGSPIGFTLSNAVEIVIP